MSTFQIDVDDEGIAIHGVPIVAHRDTVRFEDDVVLTDQAIVSLCAHHGLELVAELGAALVEGRTPAHT